MVFIAKVPFNHRLHRVHSTITKSVMPGTKPESIPNPMGFEDSTSYFPDIFNTREAVLSLPLTKSYL